MSRLNLTGVLPHITRGKMSAYFNLFSSCACTVGVHTEARDSIPPACDKNWNPVIDFTSTYGNKVQGTRHTEVPKDDPFKALALMGGDYLKNKQVVIVRDLDCPDVVISFVDREKEKELFGDEKERGIDRVLFTIPEIYREKEAKKKLTTNMGVPV